MVCARTSLFGGIKIGGNATVLVEVSFSATIS
jgi:hypothetical protein